MIRPEELRIGVTVWLKSKNEPYTIDCGHDIDEGIDSDDFEPIELSEEWLLKFGFEKRTDGHYNLLNESEVDIIIHKDLDHWRCDGICFSVNHFDYVHQLQNLFFALCGSELTIKEQ